MANLKICLDAGHYGRYNRAPGAPAYYESVMTWKLHLLLKEELEKYDGVTVSLTRTNQSTDLSLFNRGVASKGCDLFLSIHSNATGSVVDEATDYPVVIVQLDGMGDKLGEKLAECVESVMGTKQDGHIYKKRGNNGEYYGVLRGAASVGTMGMIIEHSFHTCTKMAQWLLKAENLTKLAKAEAKVIAEYYGLKAKGAESTLKSVEEVAREVLAGKWGNGTARKEALEKAGYNYSEVQSKVNELVKAQTPKKSVDVIAQEVIYGLWGNGADRKQKLTAAGYNYKEVQAKVNEMLK